MAMANMSFDEFKETIAEEIKAFLPEKYEDADISINTVQKNNEELTGITIRSSESNIAPNIYLDSYYDSYLDGESMEDIMQNIADVRVEHEIEKPLAVDMITDYEKAKDKVMPKIVGMEGNEKYLEDKPFTRMEDLAVVYYVDMGRLGGGVMSSPVTENLMETWGVSTEELHQTALSNMEAQSVSSFKSMHEMMMEMMLPDMVERFDGDKDAAREAISDMVPPDDGNMFILTNQEKLNGATALLDTKIMGEISERFGENFFILPSSLHEVLIVPEKEGMELSVLENMVQEVNASQVAPQDRLSDHVYKYDAQEQSVFRADREAEHMAEKAAKLEATDKTGEKSDRVGMPEKNTTEKGQERKRTSVKARLAEKQNIVASTARKDRPQAMGRAAEAAI